MHLHKIIPGNKKLLIYKIISGITHIIVYNFNTNVTEKYLLNDYSGNYYYIAKIYDTNYIAVLE